MTNISGYPPRYRRCSQALCSVVAAATLTLHYRDRSAVIAPLSDTPVPGEYDLCGPHARTMTFPKGWEVSRCDLGPDPVGPAVEPPCLPAPPAEPAAPAAAAPVRCARKVAAQAPAPPEDAKPRRSHLRIVRGKD
jgi:hypothetical protein